jgi:hypothetical protein
MQRAAYGGHHKTVGAKYENVIGANGMSLMFCGPYASRRQDRFVTKHSQLNDKFRDAQVRYHQNQELEGPVNFYYLYGDRIYVNDDVIRRAHQFIPTPEEEIENKIMSSLRTAVENDIALLKVQTWHGICKRMSILHNHNRIVPLAACILKNAYICMNEGSLVKRFNVTPPVLEDYFG